MERGRSIFLPVLLAITVAIALRFYALDLMEFKADEVAALTLAETMAETGVPLKTGLTSSVGIPNPPVFIYLLLPWHLLFSSPLGAVWLFAIGGLLSLFLLAFLAYKHGGRASFLFLLAFAAASPWLVIYSRKIWAQNLLAPLMALLFIALLRMAEQKKSRAAFLWPLLVAVIFGVHFSGVAVAFASVLFVVVSVGLRRINYAAFLLGVLVGLAVLSPYLVYLAGEGLLELSKALAAPKEGMGFAEALYRSFIRTGYVAFVGDHKDLMDNQFSDAYPIADYIARRGSSIALWLVWTTAAIVFMKAFSAGLRQKPIYALLFLFILVPPFVYAAGGLKVYNHYFIISMPALFLSIALVFGGAYDGMKKVLMPEIALFFQTLLVITALAFLAGGAFWLSVKYIYLTEEGGTRADYGEAYRYQERAARIIAENSDENTKVSYPRLRDKGIGVAYIAERLKKKGATVKKAAKQITVINRLVSSRKCPAREGVRNEDFGPYKVCIEPFEEEPKVDMLEPIEPEVE